MHILDELTFYFVQQESKRTYFICKSVKQIPLAVMGSGTQADKIYHKPFDGGYLYVLRYSARNQRKHLTVDNYITAIDETQKRVGNTRGTFFVSVSPVHSCKVLSFEGRDRVADPLFNEIFDTQVPPVNNEFKTKDGVQLWSKGLQLVTQVEYREGSHGDPCDKVKKQQRLLETDLVSAVLDPVCPRHRRAELMRNQASALAGMQFVCLTVFSSELVFFRWSMYV
jgi:hypothetical protein